MSAGQTTETPEQAAVGDALDAIRSSFACQCEMCGAAGWHTTLSSAGKFTCDDCASAPFKQKGGDLNGPHTTLDRALFKLAEDILKHRCMSVCRMSAIDIERDPDAVEDIYGLVKSLGAAFESALKNLSDIAGAGPDGAAGMFEDAIEQSIGSALAKHQRHLEDAREAA